MSAGRESQSRASGAAVRGADTIITHPRRISAILALVYGIVSVGYILVSGRLASSLSATKLQLYEIELLKGLVFVTLTSVLLYFLSLGFLQRLEAKEDEVRRHREVVMASERRAAAGLFAASVAHDINNVLIVLGVAVDRLSGLGSPAPESREPLETLRQTNTRLRDLVRRLGQAGGADLPVGMEELDVALVARQAVDLARHHLKLKHCEVELHIPDAVRFRGDPSLIHRMILNLLLNAGDATAHRGRVLVRLLDSSESVVLEVHDNGPGVAEADRERIFEPLYSSSRDGAGLGLLSVQTCATRHDGTVSIVTSFLGGACFRVELPRLAARGPARNSVSAPRQT